MHSCAVGLEFVCALLGPDHERSGYGRGGERIAQLAAGGIRLVVSELRADATKTRKDGSRGRLRIDYGEASQPEAALKWLWRYLEGASSAGELYGRALVVIAAEQYTARMVLPASQRSAAIHWGSRKGLAAKALRKLVGPHLPASLKALQRAVERVHKHAEGPLRQAAERRRTGAENASAAGKDELLGRPQRGAICETWHLDCRKPALRSIWG